MKCLCPCEIPRDICASFDWTWKCDTCGRRHPSHRWGCDGKERRENPCRTVSAAILKAHALARTNAQKREKLERTEAALARAIEEAAALRARITRLRADVRWLKKETEAIVDPTPLPGVDLDGPAEQPRCKGSDGR
jgi:hypothetical protein